MHACQYALYSLHITNFYVAALFLQILMSVWLTLMAVTKSVLTPLDHFSAAALTGTHSLLMEETVLVILLC